MSRESNDAFEAYAAREGYKPGTWNYIRAAKAWQAALDYADQGLNTTPVVDQKPVNLSDNAPGVAPTGEFSGVLETIDKALANRPQRAEPPQGNMTAEWPSRGVMASGKGQEG